MKHIYKLIYFCCFTILLWSCSSNDPDIINISPVSVGNINTPAQGDSFTLNPFETTTNTAITISWDEADYGEQTGITYTIEFALSNTSFQPSVVVGSTTNNFLVMNIIELNSASVGAGLAPFLEGSIDIRIKASVGTQSGLAQYSEPISILVTPFTTDLPRIAVPGNHQGWDPGSAEQLSASAFGATDYEGYVWLDGEYKFLSPDTSGNFDWGTTDWGDDGTFSGALVADDEVNCTEPTAGYYFVQADTDALTYSVASVNWGVIGGATPTGWDSDTDLVYNASNKTLEVDVDLSPGPFKFRGNDEWGAFDLGTLDDDGFLQTGGDLTFDGAAGNYHVVLDLSNPREYTYSLTLN